MHPIHKLQFSVTHAKSAHRIVTRYYEVARSAPCLRRKRIDAEDPPFFRTITTAAIREAHNTKSKPLLLAVAPFRFTKTQSRSLETIVCNIDLDLL